MTGRPQGRDPLAALPWPDADDREGRGRLRRTFDRLAEALGPDIVMLLVQAQAYHQQYGFCAVFPVPVNLDGPADNFDPSSHVIPALIKRFTDARDAGAPAVQVWGDGTASRELLYVDDAAQGLVLLTERYDSPEPVNLGSGQEVMIKDLAQLIMELGGYRSRLGCDPTKPNGQPWRSLDVSRAEREFDFRARTDSRIGLRETIAWYGPHRADLLPAGVTDGSS